MTCSTDSRETSARQTLKSTCSIEETKGGLLDDCCAWVLDDPQLQSWQQGNDTRLLWIEGHPGKGKKMLMISLINQLVDSLKANKSRTLTFFCQNTVLHLNNAISVLRGLIWKLLVDRPYMRKYVPKEYSSRGKGIFEGLNAFCSLTAMLSAILRDPSLEMVYLFVDALDECDEDSGRLIRWIAKDASERASKSQWLLSSRHAPKIEEALRPNGHRQKLSLGSNDKHICPAVDQFIAYKLNDLANKRKYDPELRSKVEAQLKEKAESTFLWIALVCKRLEDIPRRKTMAELEKFQPGLQALYERMMRQMESLEHDDRELCEQILRATTLAYRPLTLEELFPVIGLPDGPTDDIAELVELCSSFLILRAETVYFVHQSAKDYFTTGEGRRVFPSGPTEEHANVTS
ncbi:MAG: hypothetical protein M1840_000258 [Geoglossum simile]|nr:MAG: hypothetical protein M1840_000258 [Geoglossum simile]